MFNSSRYDKYPSESTLYTSSPPIICKQNVFFFFPFTVDAVCSRYTYVYIFKESREENQFHPFKKYRYWPTSSYPLLPYFFISSPSLFLHILSFPIRSSNRVFADSYRVSTRFYYYFLLIMAMTNAERMKKYREKLKTNKIKYEEMKAKNRCRNNSMRTKLTGTSLAEFRKKNKLRQRKYREKKNRPQTVHLLRIHLKVDSHSVKH